MDVKEIVSKCLVENGYDGLTCRVGCACDVSDLIPCLPDEKILNCEEGWKVLCGPETRQSDDECSWPISTKGEKRRK